MSKAFPLLVTIVIGVTFVMASSTKVLAEDFYKGKTLRMVVGFSPGGSGDTHTRSAARHMSRYIPGNPTLVVQNMTGGGGILAANYIYNEAT